MWIKSISFGKQLRNVWANSKMQATVERHRRAEIKPIQKNVTIEPKTTKQLTITEILIITKPKT